MATPLGSDALRALYRTMAAIRAFDARIRRGFAAGEFPRPGDAIVGRIRADGLWELDREHPAPGRQLEV